MGLEKVFVMLNVIVVVNSVLSVRCFDYVSSYRFVVVRISSVVVF